MAPFPNGVTDSRSPNFWVNGLACLRVFTDFPLYFFLTAGLFMLSQKLSLRGRSLSCKKILVKVICMQPEPFMNPTKLF